MKRLAVAFAAVVALSVSAPCATASPANSAEKERWTITSLEPSHSATAINLDTIKDTKRGVKAWCATIFSPALKDETADMNLDQMEFDCLNKQARFLALKTYIGARAVSNSTPKGESKWMAATPNTPVMYALQFVCKFKKDGHQTDARVFSYEDTTEMMLKIKQVLWWAHTHPEEWNQL